MDHKRFPIQIIICCVLLVISPQVTSIVLPTTGGHQETLSDFPIAENSTNIISSVIYSSDSYNLVKKYYAVLVAIDDYPGDSGDLPYSVHQINAFKTTLMNGGNWEDTNIQTLTNQNATKSHILNAIEEVAAKEDRNDLSLLYLVGHGGHNTTNECYKTYDAIISDTELARAIDPFEGDLVIIIDCCYSGGFIEDLRGAKRVILTASDKNEPTYQYEELQSGFFGYFLNRTLEKYTKTIEATFLLACPLTIRYSEQLSEQLSGNYTVHPCISDGTLGLIKLIHRHQYATSFAAVFIEPFLQKYSHISSRNIWRH